MTAVLNRKKNLEFVFHPPPSPKVFRRNRRKGSQTMHSVSVTPIYQPCEQGVNLFCFLCFSGFFVLFRFLFFFFWGGGGEGVERRGKGGSISFDFRFFFPQSYLLHYSICSSLSTNPVFLQLSVFLPSQDVP